MYKEAAFVPHAEYWVSDIFAGFRGGPRSPGTPCKSMGAIVVLLNITWLPHGEVANFGFVNPTFPKEESTSLSP